jgi:hypothetical protein
MADTTTRRAATGHREIANAVDSAMARRPSDRPRLNRRKAWGLWHLTVDGKTLVFDDARSGHYEVDLAELATVELARRRLEDVAAKVAWVDQRVVDDLRRALRELTKLDVPLVVA